MKIGFMSSTCPNYTVREIVDACTRLGFQGFEPRIDWGHAHGLEPGASPQAIRAARAIWEDAGVEVPCIASGIATAVRGPERVKELDQVQRVVELSRLVGSRYVRVFGKGAPGLDEESRMQLAIETLSEAAELIAGSGVTLLLETHDYFRAGRMVGQVVRTVNRPDEVAVLWDTMHSVVVGETLAETAAHLGLERVKHTHFRDLWLKGEKEDGTLATKPCYDYGQGNFPLGEATRLLTEAGYTGYASLEVIFKPTDRTHDPEAFLAAHARGMKLIHQSGA